MVSNINAEGPDEIKFQHVMPTNLKIQNVHGPNLLSSLSHISEIAPKFVFKPQNLKPEHQVFLDRFQNPENFTTCVLSGECNELWPLQDTLERAIYC